MKLLAIDPGGACLGWAWFVDGVLVACGLSRTKERLPFARAQAHRAALAHYYDQADRVVCEAMWFRGVENKGSPQILIDLNLIAGHMGREWFVPHQWKGMVSKKVHQPLILAALSAAERACLPKKPKSLVHNAVDAAGIGLYALGRMRPEGRVDVQRLLQAPRRKRDSKPRTKKRSARSRGVQPLGRRAKNARGCAGVAGLVARARLAA